jgi:hypothetical protein
MAWAWKQGSEGLDFRKTRDDDGEWIGESEFDRWGVYDRKYEQWVDWAPTRAYARDTARFLNQRIGEGGSKAIPLCRADMEEGP